MSGYSHLLDNLYFGVDNVVVVNNVRKRRKQLGLKQDTLSRLAKVGRSTISNIETGKYIPGVDIALLLSNALQCKVEELFKLEGE